MALKDFGIKEYLDQSFQFFMVLVMEIFTEHDGDYVFSFGEHKNGEICCQNQCGKNGPTNTPDSICRNVRL
jgi:hypothetical protein